MAMTWSQLTGSRTTPGSIARWLNNSQISSGTDGDADNILQEAMDWITGSGLKHWRMIQPPVTGTMTIGQSYIELPDDLYEANIFYITGINYQKMTMKTMQEVIGNYSYDATGALMQAQPTMYYVDAQRIQFESAADQAYPYLLVYFQKVPDLSITNQTNFLTQNYRRLVRCAVMANASEWAKDSGTGAYDRTYWVQQAMSEQQAAQADSDRSRRATEFAGVLVGGGAEGFPAYGGW